MPLILFLFLPRECIISFLRFFYLSNSAFFQAARILNIFAYVKQSFVNASIPVQRLMIHVRRLVNHGLKVCKRAFPFVSIRNRLSAMCVPVSSCLLEEQVGVVTQTETAALKSIGSNKSQPFTRQLSALYTKATFMEDEEE